MLQYEKIVVSEGIDTNKTSVSKECMQQLDSNLNHIIVTMSRYIDDCL